MSTSSATPIPFGNLGKSGGLARATGIEPATTGSTGRRTGRQTRLRARGGPIGPGVSEARSGTEIAAEAIVRGRSRAPARQSAAPPAAVAVPARRGTGSGTRESPAKLARSLRCGRQSRPATGGKEEEKRRGGEEARTDILYAWPPMPTRHSPLATHSPGVAAGRADARPLPLPLVRRGDVALLELFARWGPLFSASPRLPVSASPSPAPPIGSVWPGPQGLLFPLVTGLFSALR